MDEFIITISAIGKYPRIPISEKKFNEIKQAKKILRNFSAIENLYEILFLNYRELERESLLISLDQMLTNASSYKLFSKIKLNVNRRIMNILTTARAYICQSPKYIASCFNDYDKVLNKEVKRFRDKKNQFNFGFVEALRNHVQHHGLPVHLFTAHSKWTDDFNNMEFWNTVSVKKEYLVEDVMFPKKILSQMPDKIDIVLSFREYICELSFLHDSIRQDYGHLTSNSRNLLEKYIDLYAKQYTEKAIGLFAMHKSNDKLIDSVPIFLEWDNVRLELEKKHSPLVNLAKRCVTNMRSKQ